MKRFWIDYSITKKVFLLTALMFSIYIILTFIIQIVFYGKIYTYYKREELSKQVEEFAKTYVELSSDDDIKSSIVSYSNNNDSYMVVMDKQGNILYSASYEMKILLDSGENVTISLDGTFHDKIFSDLNIKVGDYVFAEYITVDENNNANIYIPTQIANSKGIWKGNRGGPNRSSNEEFPENTEMGYGQDRNSITDTDIGYSQNRNSNSDTDKLNKSTISGVVTSITVPDEKNMGNNIMRAESFRAAMQWINRVYRGERLEDGQKIHYIYSPEGGRNKYVVVVKNVEYSGESQMIFAIRTLESVDEAVEVMKGSYYIWLFVAILVIIGMAIIFSKLITRPILNITQVTTKMKNLDFSQKCIVHSKDEVGKLAENVNDMSEKLDTTIKELVDANEKLLSDIEHERKMELIRREFVAAVSHELKTPLAIIRAYSEAIVDAVSAQKQERYINVIIDETKKMDTLILDMLQNSKLEAGAQKLDIKEYDICGLANKTITRLKQNMKIKNIDVILNTSHSVINAEFDWDKIEQVICNFITNAIKHTPVNKDIIINIDKQGDKVLFSVENKGENIPEDEIDKVWDKFYKVDKSRDRSMGGTGLGLSIAKNILVLHKAEYGVENVDDGVRFWFKL